MSLPQSRRRAVPPHLYSSAQHQRTARRYETPHSASPTGRTFTTFNGYNFPNSSQSSIEGTCSLWQPQQAQADHRQFTSALYRTHRKPGSRVDVYLPPSLTHFCERNGNINSESLKHQSENSSPSPTKDPYSKPATLDDHAQPNSSHGSFHGFKSILQNGTASRFQEMIDHYNSLSRPGSAGGQDAVSGLFISSSSNNFPMNSFLRQQASREERRPPPGAVPLPQNRHRNKLSRPSTTKSAIVGQQNGSPVRNLGYSPAKPYNVQQQTIDSATPPRTVHVEVGGSQTSSAVEFQDNAVNNLSISAKRMPVTGTIPTNYLKIDEKSSGMIYSPASQRGEDIKDNVSETEVRLTEIRNKLAALSSQPKGKSVAATDHVGTVSPLSVRARLTPVLRPSSSAPSLPRPSNEEASTSSTATCMSSIVTASTATTTSATDVQSTGSADDDDTTIEEVADDDALDCLDDDVVSTCSGLTFSRPASAPSSRPASRRGSSSGIVHEALIPSLFPHVPPVIHFVADGESVESLPWELRRLLKWRMSTITPIVVKKTIARSNFKISRKSHDWLGYFGKHMKPNGFRAIREYQKVNHFPGSFAIGRKDRLWKGLHKMQMHFGKKDFNFFPLTYCMPGDAKTFKRVWEDGGHKHKWIIKPPASARGQGIRVVNKWNQIPKKRNVIVQSYLAKPLLINESKFDLRIYVYVSSFDPLRVYVHEEGLVRFASVKYSHSNKSIGNRFMHLTNYSVNKQNANYSVCSNNDGEGHKWSLKALWAYLKRNGHSPEKVWSSIKDLVIKTVISGESSINSMIKAFCRRRNSVHELFGFDIILDEKLKPWLLEVNISPSLHSNSSLDTQIKGAMIKDFMNLAGFQIPDPLDMTDTGNLNTSTNSSKLTDRGHKGIYADRRCWTEQTLSPDERSKKLFYTQHATEKAVLGTILDVVTPDDTRMLVESLDEFHRAGDFVRVFPCGEESVHYMKFMEQPRYYNLLLVAFLSKYQQHESKGMSCLTDLCKKRLHLDCPTNDPKHLWSTPRHLLSITRCGS